MQVTRELLDELPSHDGVYNFAGERFRVVQPVAITYGTYCNASIVMKESVVAQLLSLWYRHINKVLVFLSAFEWPLLKRAGVKEGEVLPWWSITRLVASTQISS